MAAALFVTIGTPAAIAGPSYAVSPTFALRDLGTFPGQYISHAAGINDAGQVVGYAQYGIYSEHSVLWENGKIVDLSTPTIPGGYPGAQAINAAGQIVGGSAGPDGGWIHAVLWDNGTAVDLGLLNGAKFGSSDATGISDAGQIVGFSTGAVGPGEHAVVWNARAISDLGTLPGDAYSEATGVNNAGQIVGYSGAASVPHAVLWQNGRISNIDGLPGAYGNQATAINDIGQVVGYSTTSNGFRPWLWSSGTITELPSLPTFPGGIPLGINNRGQIVGESGRNALGVYHAVLWDTGTAIDLGAPADNGIYSSAKSINIRGQIAGISQVNGLFHAVIWQRPPVTTAVVTGNLGHNGWYIGPVKLILTATSPTFADNFTSGVASTTYSVNGGMWQVYDAKVPPTFPTDGLYSVKFRSADIEGNVETDKTIIVKIDQTPPTVTCSVSPAVLWPPDHKLVDVAASVNVQDATSGPAGFQLASITSSESGTAAAAMQHWTVGTPDIAGQLDASRDAGGTGRTYTLVYAGADQAGNTATCHTMIVVPHDQR